MRTFEQIRDDARNATLADIRIASDRLVDRPKEFESRVRLMIGPDSLVMNDEAVAAHCTTKCVQLRALATRGHWTFSSVEYLGWLALRDAANLLVITKARKELVSHAG